MSGFFCILAAEYVKKLFKFLTKGSNETILRLQKVSFLYSSSSYLAQIARYYRQNEKEHC